jgi:hypothetical protein
MDVVIDDLVEWIGEVSVKLLVVLETQSLEG